MLLKFKWLSKIYVSELHDVSGVDKNFFHISRPTCLLSNPNHVLHLYILLFQPYRRHIHSDREHMTELFLIISPLIDCNYITYSFTAVWFSIVPHLLYINELYFYFCWYLYVFYVLPLRFVNNNIYIFYNKRMLIFTLIKQRFCLLNIIPLAES